MWEVLFHTNGLDFSQCMKWLSFPPFLQLLLSQEHTLNQILDRCSIPFNKFLTNLGPRLWVTMMGMAPTMSESSGHSRRLCSNWDIRVLFKSVRGW